MNTKIQLSSVSSSITILKHFLAIPTVCSTAANFAIAAIKLGSALSTFTFSFTLTSFPPITNTISNSSCSSLLVAPIACANRDVIFGTASTNSSDRTTSTNAASWMLKSKHKSGVRGGSKALASMGGVVHPSSGVCGGWPGGDPFKVARASEMMEWSSRSWPDMNAAEVRSPVQRVMSTQSRALLTRVRRVTRGLRTKGFSVLSVRCMGGWVRRRRTSD